MDNSRMMNQPTAAEGLVSLEIEGRGKVVGWKPFWYWLAYVTGLGPDYIIPGPWPELTPSALWF